MYSKNLWTADEDATLLEGWRDGLTASEIVERYGLDRTAGAASARLLIVRGEGDPRLGPTDRGIAMMDIKNKRDLRTASTQLLRGYTRYAERHAPGSAWAAQCREAMRKIGARA
jgi:hypothetical protein